MNLTIILAVYGAVLSTILLIWNIFRDLTDKGKLKVHCFIGRQITPDDPEDKNNYLIYNITNTGRKPIMATEFGGRTKEHDFIITPRHLPKMLNPGEYIIESTPNLDILDDNLKSLWVADSLGKKYKVGMLALELLLWQRRKMLKE